MSESEATNVTQTADDEGFSLKGHKLDEMGGVQVGRVEGKASGQMEWLLARMGRFGHYCG